MVATPLVRSQVVTLALLFLAGIVNFLDRSALSIANGPIRQQLHLSATSMGALLSAFSLAYGFAQLPIGPLLDRAGAQRMLGAGLALWSTATALTGAVLGIRSFLALRVLLGLGEAPFFPASLRIVREEFVPQQRGRAIATINISTTLGQGIAPPLLTLLLLRAGWRAMFAMIGGVGLLLAAAWLLLLRRESSVRTPPAPLAETFAGWAALFRVPAIWGLMLGFGGVNYTSWFFIAWLPAYLQTSRGISIKTSGWLAALPFLAGSLGMLLSGVLADRRVRGGAVVARVHRSQVIVGMVLSALSTLLAIRAASLAVAMACICGALLFIHFAGTSAWGYVQAASPRALVATVGSIQNFGSFMIASAAPLLTGWILDRTHAFAGSFLLCAVVALCGAASYILLVKDSLPLSEA
ncbi:MFS transporter [Granulicella sp. WH15]|uniref:MFS transporter n=1 Tax=Granulicella sp. WH15 TaxID=2602070 RepID=UPI0021059180|nr:MFS transporter [Granulicella sp. WH15]